MLWEGQKSCLPGVWDPAPGEEKHLLIRYTFQVLKALLSTVQSGLPQNLTSTFQGHKHQLFCPEEEAVKLPKTAHRLS